MTEKSRTRKSSVAVWFGSLVLAFAFAINWLLTQSETSNLTVPGNDPDFYLRNARVQQYDETGRLQHELDAHRFTHYPVTDITTLQTPILSLSNTSDTSPWKIAAAKGRILRSTNYRDETVEFWGQVRITRGDSNGSFTSILTESLTVHPDRKYAETDTRVILENQTGQTTAAGMRVFFDSNELIFHSSIEDRVTTIFLAAPLD